jgi:hypothetical protein
MGICLWSKKETLAGKKVCGIVWRHGGGVVPFPKSTPATVGADWYVGPYIGQLAST